MATSSDGARPGQGRPWDPDDEAIALQVAEALARLRAAQGASLPDPLALLAEARQLLAHWDAEAYGACCTTDPAYKDLRQDLGEIAHVADTLLVDVLTGALTAASRLPRSVTRLIATYVVKHGFATGRGLVCSAWARVVSAPPPDAGPAARDAPLSP